MTKRIGLLEEIPVKAHRTETPIEEIWGLVKLLTQRKVIQVKKTEMSEAKILGVENSLDDQNWKLESYEEDTGILYLRAFDWSVAD